MDAKRIVDAARSVVAMGAHDPGPHGELIAGHEGPHHLGVVAGILRKAGLANVPNTVEELIELAKANSAWVEPKVDHFGGYVRPEAGDVVVVSRGKHGEHCYIVCSISEHHLESIDGGQQLRRYGLKMVNGEQKPTRHFGGDLIEYRSRQWSVETPTDEEGNEVGPAFIVDGAHAHLEEKRHPARVVAGWVRSSQLPELHAVVNVEKAKTKDAPKVAAAPAT